MKEVILNDSVWRSIEERLSQRDPSYLEKIKTTDRRRYDWSLCESGTLSEAELLEIYLAATQLGTIEEEELPEPAAIPYLSPEYLSANCCLGLEEENNVLKLLVCDPYSINRHRYFIEKLHGREVHFRLIRRSLLERLIAKLNSAQNRDGGQDGVFSDTENEEMLKSLASEAKIVRLVNEIFSRAVEQRASDIHIEPRETELAIRFRIDGVLHTYLSCPLSQYPAVASRIKLIGGLNIAERRLPQDGRTNFLLGGKELDIRISTIPTICGESIVLRILRKDTLAFELSHVGMTENLQKKFEKLIKLPHGMVLVVGPTGSGKTTTLYSVIDKLNDGKHKIITIEDPVEYKFPGISQMQANAEIGLTFASGLRHIVRQDPDIILVGEIRDRETAAIAINAALTGHLVFSTLHTNDSAGAVSRLLDMGVEGFLVSSSLAGVLSQRLVRTICPECGGSGINFNFTGNRCKNCSGTGFRGRTGIFELLLVDDDIRAAILRNATSMDISSIAVKKGMMPLNEYGMLKVKDGVTTAEEVLMATIDNE